MGSKAKGQLEGYQDDVHERLLRREGRKWSDKEPARKKNRLPGVGWTSEREE